MSQSFSSAMPHRALQADAQGELTAIGWQGRLNECVEPHEVVMAVKEYLARWNPEEIGALPDACRPGRVVDGEDVAGYALALARAQCDGMGPLVDKLAVFMTSAALRLAQISARTSEVCAEDDPD